MQSKGLSSEEAKRLLKKYGKNEVQRKKKVSPVKIFLDQFKSSLVIILIISAIVLAVINYFSASKSSVDIILILAIILISGISGFIQDYKAEKSIESLQEMSTPKTKVFRDGKINIISSLEVVPGDILLLEAGDVIPADAKLIEARNVQINESALTGESKPVDKKSKKEVYMYTYITSGNATAKVISTGMKTKIGQIAHKLESIKEEKTQFYTQIDNLSKRLSWIILGVVIITAVAGLFRYNIADSVLIAVALAVAAIPEGMPAVLVLSLAASSKVMLRNNALVRRLSVIESIGNVNYICTDKTGTITKNEMSVTMIYSNWEETHIRMLKKEDIKQLFLCGTLNNNTREVFDKELKITGDETEIALRNFGERFGYSKNNLESKYKRIYEIPFDSKRKMMSVVVKDGPKNNIVYTKGAPENILDKCTKILIRGRVTNLRQSEKSKILQINDKFASKGLRVLGFAYKEIVKPGEKDEDIEKELIFIGLEGIIDPPREGVKTAIQNCKTAGITVLMLTGDNPMTAKAISEEVNIKTKKVMIGADIEKIDDESLYRKITEGCRVFARLTPEHKLRIMTILQKKNNIVAMTGDGINDALALKKADIGIAMGIRGTDVAKEASDLILLDDNFVTIVSAIREGRKIFENIRKFTNYLLTSNFAEVAVIFFATLFLTLNQPILLPVQLLWINLLTDGFPAIALGTDPAREKIMQDHPRKKSEHIINKRLYWTISTIGIVMTIMLFATFFLTLYFTKNNEIARTTIFTGFILYEFIRVAVIKHQEKLKWFSNRFILFALGASLALQVLIIYTPINSLFGITPMHATSWIILLSGVLIGYFLSIWISNIIIKYVKED